MRLPVRTMAFTGVASSDWVLLGFLGLSAPSSAETVHLHFDPDIPQIAFAAADIKAALEKRDVGVQTRNLTHLAKHDSGQKVVIAVASDENVASMLSDQGDKLAVGLGEQAYALRTKSKPELSYWVPGGDTVGAMYGGLQLVENIHFKDMAETFHEDDAPHLKNRGIKFNVPL